MRKIHTIPIFAVLVLVTSISIPEVYATSLTLNPTSGPPDSPVTISGNGFPANANLFIFFGDLRKDTVTVTSTSLINIGIPVPHTATIGTTYTICISADPNSCTNPLASAQFQVTAGSISVPEFPFSFSMVIIFAAVAAVYVVIRQKMTTNFRPF